MAQFYYMELLLNAKSLASVTYPTMRMEHLYVGLGLVGLVVVVIMWNRVLNWICFKLSGWPSLAALYPPQTFGQARETYKGTVGAVGKIRMRRGFRIEVSDDGLKITPRFARNLPLFVPWSRVVSVESVPFCILVKLDSNAWFYLPNRALDLVKQRVRPEALK